MTDEMDVHHHEAEGWTLRDVGSALYRNRFLFLGVTLAVIAATMLITFLLPPSYESEALLRIKDDEQTGGLMAQLGPLADIGGLSDLATSDIDTEVGVMRSRRITSAVADSLALNVELEEPDEPRSEIIRVLDGGEEAVEGTYTLDHQGNGVYSASASRTAARVDVPDRVTIGEPFRMGNMVLAIQPSLRGREPDEIRLEVEPFQEVVEDFREELEIDRQESGSNLVEIIFRHRDPRIAAGAVNGIAERFIEYSLRTGRADSRRSATVLREQVAQYQSDLRDAEEALRAYQQQERIIAPEEQAIQQIRRVAEVQAQRDALLIERQALGSLLDVVATRERDSGGPSPYRQLATFPSFISNGAVQTLLETVMELENERTALLARRTEENLDVQILDRRIAELESQLFRLATGYSASLTDQINAANEALTRFGVVTAEIPAQAVEYARLRRETELLSEVYLMLQGRLKEAEVDEAINDADVRLIDSGLVMEEPEFPKPWVNLALGAALGLILGLMAVVVAEMNRGGQVRTEVMTS